MGWLQSWLWFGSNRLGRYKESIVVVCDWIYQVIDNLQFHIITTFCLKHIGTNGSKEIGVNHLFLKMHFEILANRNRFQQLSVQP